MPHFRVKTYGDEYNLSVAFRVFENMDTENPKRHLTGHTLNFKITKQYIYFIDTPKSHGTS